MTVARMVCVELDASVYTPYMCCDIYTSVLAVMACVVAEQRSLRSMLYINICTKSNVHAQPGGERVEFPRPASDLTSKIA